MAATSPKETKVFGKETFREPRFQRALQFSGSLGQVSMTSVVQWLQLFFPFSLVAAPQKWSKPKKKVPVFPRVTEQLSDFRQPC